MAISLITERALPPVRGRLQAIRRSVRQLLRTVLAIFVVLGVPGAAASGQEVRVGLKIGLAASHQTEDREGLREAVTGLTAGPFASLELSDLLTVQVEALAIQKGWEQSSDMHLHISYLESPLLLVVRPLRTSIRPVVIGGVAPALELSCDFAFPAPPSSDSEVWTAECSHQRSERADFGLVLGAGLEWRAGALAMVLEGRYAHGVLDIAGDDVFRVVKNRTKYLFLSVALRL